MQWTKSPQSLIDSFTGALPDDGRAERRKMFGYPCCFANGNMFAGLHQANVVLRLPEAEREELLTLRGAKVFEPMAGRPMREYVTLPPEIIADGAALRGWIGKSFAYALSLAPKVKKAPTAKKPRKAAART